jgi:hypothetical protein
VKRLFGLLIVAGLLMPLVGCADHDHDDDDDDGASLKVKVDD